MVATFTSSNDASKYVLMFCQTQQKKKKKADIGFEMRINVRLRVYTCGFPPLALFIKGMLGTLGHVEWCSLHGLVPAKLFDWA